MPEIQVEVLEFTKDEINAALEKAIAQVLIKTVGNGLNNLGNILEIYLQSPGRGLGFISGKLVTKVDDVTIEQDSFNGNLMTKGYSGSIMIHDLLGKHSFTFINGTLQDYDIVFS
jgi:hypothetical protein